MRRGVEGATTLRALRCGRYISTYIYRRNLYAKPKSMCGVNVVAVLPDITVTGRFERRLDNARYEGGSRLGHRTEAKQIRQ